MQASGGGNLSQGETFITEEQVRDVLAHLYDNAYLSKHELLPLLVRAYMPDPTARTQRLRSLVIEAINGLRPPPSVTPRSREWRPYGALVYRYLDGMTDEQAQRELAISERQLYRDLKTGVALLTEKLQALLTPEAEAEQDALAASLRRVGLKLERLQLDQLCQQVLPLVQGLADALGKAISLRVEPGATIAVGDAALSRQALISVLSYALRHAAGDVLLQLKTGTQMETLVVHFREPPAPAGAAAAPGSAEASPDEALAVGRQLLEQQGGSLLVEASEGAECKLALGWRRFEQPPILIVEDDPGILRLFGRCLDGHGYRVIAAADGREAVRLASENRARLVLLDVMMRDMDGWAVLQRLKADPATKSIPVLVCSVINEPQLATTLGAAGLLKKPVSCEQLVDAVAAVVGI